MLADDPLGATRETPPGPDGAVATAYLDAFAAISCDPNHELLVAERRGSLAGVLQLSFVPGLSRRGMWRAQIEGVRVASSFRSAGIGALLVGAAIDRAKLRGCGLIQLTSDKARGDAHAFYTRLGFAATHDGFKLSLD